MHRRRRAEAVLLLFLAMVALTRAVRAEEASEQRLRALEERVERQEEEIRRLRSALGEQGTRREALDAEISEYLGDREAEAPWQVDGALRVRWKDSLFFDTPDGAFGLAVGGRLNIDWGTFDADRDVESEIGAFEDEVGFRRARIYILGTIHDMVELKADLDFAGGKAAFKDVWTGLKGIPVVGRVRVGHLKEPFGLEELTSGKFLTFLERGLPVALVPDRNLGILLQNDELDGRFVWALGWFNDTDGFGGGVSGNNQTLRIAGAPWLAEGGEGVLHLGVAYSHRMPADDTVRFSAKPEAGIATRPILDTGEIPDVSREHRLAVEAALVLGPLSFQGEFIRVRVLSDTARDPSFTGVYAFLSYFLTGEHRVYRNGNFRRVRPRADFMDGGSGTGAWEVALRYSRLDLDDGEVRGGRAASVTLGLNWHLNPNTRVMVNLVRGGISGVGDLNALLVRFHVDF